MRTDRTFSVSFSEKHDGWIATVSDQKYTSAFGTTPIEALTLMVTVVEVLDGLDKGWQQQICNLPDLFPIKKEFP